MCAVRRLPGSERKRVRIPSGWKRPYETTLTTSLRFVSSIHQMRFVRSPQSAENFLVSVTERKKRKAEQQPVNFIRSVGELLNDLAQLGHLPTLVGGMALVTLGSKRVTRGFDFLIAEEARDEEPFIQIFYKHGFQLVSKIDQHGEIVRTINNQKIASMRLRIDQPRSAYFYSHTLGLRVDLLFDFPINARDVQKRSTHKTIQSYSFRIAGKEDLIKMKEIAAKDRRRSSDVQDLEFLKGI